MGLNYVTYFSKLSFDTDFSAGDESFHSLKARNGSCFLVYSNVQIFTYSFNGYVDEKRISFDSFEQKFKETNNDEYGYFKFALFRITIENNIVVKIEEQYLP